jgi:hypothetical protein
MFRQVFEFSGTVRTPYRGPYVRRIDGRGSQREARGEACPSLIVSCILCKNHTVQALVKDHTTMALDKGMQNHYSSSDDESSSVDEDGILFQRDPSSASNSGKKAIPSAPPANMQWNDNAILDCFQMSVESHEEKNPKVDWKPPPFYPEIDLSPLSKWQPEELVLPSWAVVQDQPSPSSKEVVSKPE